MFVQTERVISRRTYQGDCSVQHHCYENKNSLFLFLKEPRCFTSNAVKFKFVSSTFGLNFVLYHLTKSSICRIRCFGGQVVIILVFAYSCPNTPLYGFKVKTTAPRENSSVPGETRNGSLSLASRISSTPQKGFSLNSRVYSNTPRDHISSSGPSQLQPRTHKTNMKTSVAKWKTRPPLMARWIQCLCTLVVCLLLYNWYALKAPYALIVHCKG